MSNTLQELLGKCRDKQLLQHLSGKIKLPLLLLDTEGHLVATGADGFNYLPRGNPAPSAFKAMISYMNRPVGYIASPVTGEHMESVLMLAGENLETSLRLEAEIEDMASEIVHVYDELSTIYSLSKKLGSAMDVDELCMKAVEECQSVLLADTIVLMLLDYKSNTLVKQACSGNSDRFIDKLPVSPSNSMLSELFSRNSAMLVDAGLVAFGQQQCDAGQTALCIPLISDNRNIGIIIVTDRRAGREFRSQEIKQMDAISSEIAVAIKKAQLYEQINRLFIHTVEALASAIDAKDPYTYGHSRRVADYCSIICRGLSLSRKETKAVELASLLHDIGKIGVPEAILQKPYRLLPEEIDRIREHPVRGAQILCAIDELKNVIDGIRHHHERFDGSGYPDQIMSNQIPIQARIIAVADCFDAMTSNRPYRKSMDAETAISIMEDSSGSQFDPEIFAAFKAIAATNELKAIYQSVPDISFPHD